MSNDPRRRTAGDRMNRAIEVAHLHETVASAEARMSTRDVSCLPVLDGDRLVGLITRSDVARLGAAGNDLARMTLRDATPPKTFHCFADNSPAEAAATMDALGIDHLAVLDHHKQLVGVLARRDLPAGAGGQRAPVTQAPGEDESAGPEPGLRVYSEKPRLKS